MVDVNENGMSGTLSGKITIPSLDVLQVSLDARGIVRTCNRPASKFFSALAGQVVGIKFIELVSGLNPGWVEPLTPLLTQENSEPVFLTWNREDQPGLGWTVMTLPFGPENASGMAVSLVPGIAPDLEAMAMQDGLGGEVGPALHNLFFRTRQVEARFRQFLRILPGVSYNQGKDLTFSYRNEELKSLLGPAFTELENGAQWMDWIHPEDRLEFDQNLSRCLENHTPAATRFRLCPDEDRLIYILDLRIPVRSISGELTGFEGLWLDLTRQTIAEKRLQRAAWKESLAEVTGSLSHDFNNTLTGIVNLSDLMGTSESGSDAIEVLREDMRIIHSSARQAQHLIQRIVSLNREHTGEIALYDLVDIVRQQQDLVRIILPRNVELSADLPDASIPVRIDKSAIRRILINFATNARDALDYRGQVRIILRILELSGYSRDHLFSSRCGHSGKAAELIFRDDGCGIDPKILHRIFGAYFSTKEASKGSGLGLYSMTQFARENGFDFGVRSKPGEGTDMILLIPVEELDLSESAEEPAAPVEEAGPRKPPPDTRVALYADLDDTSMPLVRELLGSGINVEIIEDTKSACKWLSSEASGGDIFVKLMDHRKECPDEVLDHLRKVGRKIRRYLCVRGFNPDEISHLGGDAFDVIFEEPVHPPEYLKILIDSTAISTD